MRIYGLRNWVEQSYKQVKDELGWAGFLVRSDAAIRRHQALVCCAFSFCRAAWPADLAMPAASPAGAGDGERGAASGAAAGPVLAPGAPRRARLAHPVDRAAAPVAGMVQGAPRRRNCRP